MWSNVFVLDYHLQNVIALAPRPLVVTMQSPELAKEYHKYGNGSRLTTDNQDFWVNPDYMLAERRANYRARQARKHRGRGGNTSNQVNEDNVVKY